MILIICLSNDNGVVKVCKWLKYYGYRFAIISERNLVKYNFYDGEIIFSIDGKEYLNIKTGWIRNPYLALNSNTAAKNGRVAAVAEKYILADMQKNQEFIFNHLKRYKDFLGTTYSQDINKLMLLESAIALGMQVPKYIVATSKRRLIDFRKKYPKIITKSIGWNINFSIGPKKYFAYTELINDLFLEKIPDIFQHSFFQEYINADFELRVVVVVDKIFTMAHKKKLHNELIDLRQADIKEETFPFQLPRKIELMLTKLMQEYTLDFCVFDILLLDNIFYLIDINPTGQFTNVSQKCNYNIELEIAKILINRNEAF